jgi:opacity protein-like surface antigen
VEFIRRVPILGIILLFGTMAFAQSDHKIEVTGNYSYIHVNPQNNNIIPTLSLNGGGGSGAFYFSKNIGIVAEFEGYGSYTHNINTGAGLVSVSGNLFTYNVGPIVKFRFSRFEPFVETMFGGAHSNFYGNLYNNCGGSCASTSPSNNAFDFIIGGGVDLPVSSKVAIRPLEFDYLLTRFGNAFTGGNNNQSNFRYQAGLQLRF